MSTRIDIETIVAACKVLAEFNAMDMRQIDLYEGGYKIAYSPENNFENNVGFVLTRMWKPKETTDAGTVRGSPEEERGQVHGLQEG